MKAIYAGVFLDADSKKGLQNKYDICDKWKVYADHITIKFGLSEKDIGFFTSVVNVKIHFSTIGYVSDLRALATRVMLGDPKLQCAEFSSDSKYNCFMNYWNDIQYPHITIACANKTLPQYSNGLLSQNKITSMQRQFYVGQIGIFDGHTGEPYFGSNTIS